MKTIKMRRRAWGYPDGLTMCQYEEGAVVTVPDGLADTFIGAGMAEAAPEPQGEAAKASAAAPPVAPAVAIASATAPEAPVPSAAAPKAPRSLTGAKNKSLSKGDAED